MVDNVGIPITPDRARQLAKMHGTPLYVYDAAGLRARAQALMKLRAPYGMTVRFAMKANPHTEIVKMFAEEGLGFDASSDFEVLQLLKQGITGESISLSSQQPAKDLSALLNAGVRHISTSLHQLELFAVAEGRPRTVGLRVNPGVGHGHNNRVTTGGLASSFGLWHDYVPQALAYAKKMDLTIDTLQVHVGSASDPNRWGEFIDIALDIAMLMPDVLTLNMGGGFKTAYADDDVEADMSSIEEIFYNKLVAFAETTGRQLRLDIEPGRWLVAHSGVLLTEIVDVVDTGKDGHVFLRTNTGMNDFLRASMYGAQHRMLVLNESAEKTEYVVVGHNCETGDILTPAAYDPEGLLPRPMNSATIGDLLAICDTGAYCASMSAKGYNAYPDAKEIFI